MEGWRLIRSEMQCEDEFKNQMERMVMQELAVFYKEGDMLNITNVLEHHIPMKEGQRPVNIPQFPIALSQVIELRPVMLRFRDRMNIFEPAMGSQWNSPLCQWKRRRVVNLE